MTKLNQIIAVEKGIKSRVYGEITEMHKSSQKPDLFNGFTKQYQKKDEEGEDLPPEKKHVQFQVPEFLKRLRALSSEMMDVTARKDWTNCKAHASVAIGDTLILKDAPVTYLLFLEKQLLDIRTFFSNLPVLDEAEKWGKDANSGLYITDPVQTHRTKKVQRPLVLVQPTKEHPAQSVMITEDVLAGFWHSVKSSGAIPKPERQKIMERVNILLNAVKAAREEANGHEEITPPNVGEAIFDYLLGKE